MCRITCYIIFVRHIFCIAFIWYQHIGSVILRFVCVICLQSNNFFSPAVHVKWHCLVVGLSKPDFTKSDLFLFCVHSTYHFELLSGSKLFLVRVVGSVRTAVYTVQSIHKSVVRLSLPYRGSNSNWDHPKMPNVC